MKWLLVLAAIGLLLFYTRKMPDVARTIGNSVRAFREGKSENKETPSGKTPAAGDESTKAPSR